MPKTLSNKVFISLNNRASNFQIFVKCSPQRTLTDFHILVDSEHCFAMVFRRRGRGVGSTANVQPQDVFKGPSSHCQFRICKITAALTTQSMPFKVRSIIKSRRTSCSVQVPFHFPIPMAVAQTSPEREKFWSSPGRDFLDKRFEVFVFSFFSSSSFFFNLKL